MFWYIFISVILLTLLWILFGPVIIFINTDRNLYHVSLPGIFRASLVPSDELFYLRFWIFFLPYTFHPFRSRRKGKKKGSARVPRKRSRRKIRGGIKTAADAVRSFRIRRLRMDIDTDDFMLNAWLIPAFSMVNNENLQLRVNFEGNLSLQLDMRTRIGTLLWIFIKNRF